VVGKSIEPPVVPTALRENMRQLPRAEIQRFCGESPVSRDAQMASDCRTGCTRIALSGAVNSIIKALSVRRDRLSSGDVPESDYYKVDIDEGEKRASGERRE
jgi:stage V sporulation protein SpoVS